MTFEKEGGLEFFETLTFSLSIISDRSNSLYDVSTSYLDMYNYDQIFIKLLVRIISDTVCLKARKVLFKWPICFKILKTSSHQNL